MEGRRWEGKGERGKGKERGGHLVVELLLAGLLGLGLVDELDQVALVLEHVTLGRAAWESVWAGGGRGHAAACVVLCAAAAR